MRTRLASAFLTLFSVMACVPSCSDAPCEEKGTCGVAPADSGAGEDAANDVLVDAGSDIVVPPGCDLNADAKDAPACVANEVGVFVDATNGNDASSGTKELPLRTIGAALGKLGGKPRVYVCEGAYAESVKLTSATSVFGGFACSSWSYSGTKPKVAPGTPGKEALVIENVSGLVRVSDVILEAAAGDTTSPSSVAVRVVKSSDVKLTRVEAKAGAGFGGATGAAGTTGTLTAVSSGAMTLNGNAAVNDTTPGALKTCTCSSGGTSTGGTGGAPAADGAGGGPSLGGPPPIDGAGGKGNTSCSAIEPNGSGNNGADAPNKTTAAAITVRGTIENGAFVSASGTNGEDGAPGQGAGGGGGRDGSSAGGGGGCGGCGGTGGKGGGGGGASIGLLAVDANVTIASSSFVAQSGGAGGPGGSAGVGGSGGGGGNGGGGGCMAGEGGKGGNGGAGAGGAGGVSIGVLYKGTKPAVDAATDAAISVGAAGDKGLGGAPGVNDGPAGVAEKVKDVSTL